jgi:hypothetical protein
MFALGFLAGRIRRDGREPGPPAPAESPHPPYGVDTEGKDDDAREESLAVEDQPRSYAKRTPVRVALFVVALLVLIGAGALLLFDSAGATKRPENPNGGLLILADSPTKGAAHLHANIKAELSNRTADGVSILELDIETPDAPIGTRFYLVASGQYAPTHDINPIYFCTLPNATVLANEIRCPDNDILSNWTAAEYRFNDKLGFALHHDLKEVTDFDGYEPGNAVTITGILSSNHADSAKVWIPFRTPDAAQVSGTRYYSYASLFAGNLGDFGSGDSLGRVSWDNSEVGGFGFSLASQRTPTDFLLVDKLAVSATGLQEGQQISWSSPEVDQPDSLQWNSAGGIRGITFGLVDPFSANRLTMNVFFAGVLLSTGISLLTLLIERVVFEHRRARREP